MASRQNKSKDQGKRKTRTHKNQQIREIAGSIAHAVTIKDEDLFFISQPSGRVPLNNPDGFGLYYHDCRYLNGYELQLDGSRPNPLGASSPCGFMSSLELTNRELQLRDGKTLPKQKIGIQWDRVIDSKNLALHDLFRFRNYGIKPAKFSVNFAFSSQFDDVFQQHCVKMHRFSKRDQRFGSCDREALSGTEQERHARPPP